MPTALTTAKNMQSYRSFRRPRLQKVTVSVEKVCSRHHWRQLTGDGLSDAEEGLAGTNPTKADSDGDGVNDGEELSSRNQSEQD